MLGNRNRKHFLPLKCLRLTEKNYRFFLQIS